MPTLNEVMDIEANMEPALETALGTISGVAIYIRREVVKIAYPCIIITVDMDGEEDGQVGYFQSKQVPAFYLVTARFSIYSERANATATAHRNIVRAVRAAMNPATGKLAGAGKTIPAYYKCLEVKETGGAYSVDENQLDVTQLSFQLRISVDYTGVTLS